MTRAPLLIWTVCVVMTGCKASRAPALPGTAIVPSPNPDFVSTELGCTPRDIEWDGDFLRVAASDEEFVAQVGCRAAAGFDWMTHRVAAVRLECTNCTFTYQSISEADDTAVVHVDEYQYVAGEALLQRMVLFLRVPALPGGVRVERAVIVQPWEGPPPG